MKPQVLKQSIISDDLCEMMRKFQLKAVEFGGIVTTTANSDEEEFSHLYRLNYIAEGQAYYTSLGETRRIDSNTLVYLPPGTILELDEGKEQVVLFFINFEVGDLALRQKFNEFMESTFPTHHVHDRDNILRHLFNRMFEEGNKKDIGYCMCVQGVFYNILMYMIRFSDRFHSVEKEEMNHFSSIDYFNQAINYINKNISKNIKVKDIATQVGISEIYLYKIFKKHARKSPQQLIMNYRIQLAKNYLRNPALSIKTIATELGFNNSNHFSAIFKKETGLSPKQYRENLKQ